MRKEEIIPQIARFEIYYERDKDKLVIALVNNGYKVWVEEKEVPILKTRKIYIVNVELRPIYED